MELKMNEYQLPEKINKAISEGPRLSEIQKKKAQTEEFIPPVVDEEFCAQAFAPAKQWVAFQALMTVDQTMELKKFFGDREIEFKAV